MFDKNWEQDTSTDAYVVIGGSRLSGLRIKIVGVMDEDLYGELIYFLKQRLFKKKQDKNREIYWQSPWGDLTLSQIEQFCKSKGIRVINIAR